MPRVYIIRCRPLVLVLAGLAGVANPEAAAGTRRYFVTPPDGAARDPLVPYASFEDRLALAGATVRSNDPCGTGEMVVETGWQGILPLLALGARIEEERRGSLATTRTVASWGLDRIDQTRPSRGLLEYAYESTGRDVVAYVLDSGVAEDGWDGLHVATGSDATGGRSTEDRLGHGTKVATVVGGATHGVAEHVTVVPVRVADDPDGVVLEADLCWGIRWVVADAEKRERPSVATLSIVIEPTARLAGAMDGRRVSWVVAADELGKGSPSSSRTLCSCEDSLAGIDGTLAVGASTMNDGIAGTTDYDSCVDLLAPGSNVLTVDHFGQERQVSGTSIAVPHVAGALVRLIQARSANTPPWELEQELLRMSQVVPAEQPTGGACHRSKWKAGTPKLLHIPPEI